MFGKVSQRVPFADQPTRKPFYCSRAEWLTVTIIVGVGWVLLARAYADADNRGRDYACASSLKQIGAAIADYRAKHHGHMPPRLSVLSRKAGQDFLVCPAISRDKVYTYRVLESPSASDIVAWDVTPHTYIGTLPFTGWSERRVLHASGKVERMPEADFQRLHLVGVTETQQR
jgi:hypothetical protein